MAQKFTAPVGCEEGKVYPISETADKLVYGEPMEMSGLKSFSLGVTLAEAELYGDDVELDNISKIAGGTVTEQTAGETKEVLDFISGRSVGSKIPAVSASNSASALGHSLLAALRSKTDGEAADGYRAWFFYKVKFTPVSHSATGKTNSFTYTPTDLTAKILANPDKHFADFDDFFGETALADARTWIRKQAGLSDD